MRLPKSALWLLLLLAPAPLLAQEGVRLGLLYQPEYAPGLVVLPFSAAADAESGVEPVRGIIRQDLEYSDRFEMKEAGTPPRPGEPFNAKLWKERGADWVLQGELKPRVGGMTLRLVLNDVVYGQVKGQQEFALPPVGDPGFRMAVHAVSDEVVRWAFGEPGGAASRIVFVLQGRGAKEIYLVDSDGENVQRITSDGSLALSPAWSPDGERIAFTSYKSGTPRLYERTLATGRDRMISDRTGLNITPAYSPDGQTMAFATTVAGNTEIATYNLARGCCLQQQTTGRRYDSLSPTYSPDGSQFAFVSNRIGEPQIYVMRPGGEARIITPYTYGKPSYNTSPDWSPKGASIAYHTRIGGVPQLAVVSATGASPRLLTNQYANEDPSWSPDGRHVVFSSPDRDGGGGLFVLDTVSGKIRPLLRGRGYGLPDWSGRLALSRAIQ